MKHRLGTVGTLGALIQERETITAAIRDEIACRRAAVSASRDAVEKSRAHLAEIRSKIRRLGLPLVGEHGD